jgi:NADPH:quinone reductase-like Zn-dependent oxidoreductase
MVRVRVTHASIGSTDVLAAAGGYLLHPFPGFTTGYDIVGVVEEGSAHAPAIRPGARVAALLPRMGGHAAHVDVPAARLVPVPDGVSSAVAATLPLDAVTARLVLAARPGASRIFVNGVGGPVGLLIAQGATAAGAAVVGTASDRTRDLAEAVGVRVVDYGSGDWREEVLAAVGERVDLAVDHRGDRSIRDLVEPGGVVVRTSFTGRPGQERADTVRGALAALTSRRPSERVISSPASAIGSPRRVTRFLADALRDVDRGVLVAPRPVLVSPVDALVGGRLRADADAGEKLVIDVD